ncbi:MAG: hypothetical protein OXQ29_26410 [Rhodospirillaceae bacterium]|nr:hypothetical protein [Rhodospirillaceae bacterium]
MELELVRKESNAADQSIEHQPAECEQETQFRKELELSAVRRIAGDLDLLEVVEMWIESSKGAVVQALAPSA